MRSPRAWRFAADNRRAREHLDCRSAGDSMPPMLSPKTGDIRVKSEKIFAIDRC
jgi:hypothetical protein